MDYSPVDRCANVDEEEEDDMSQDYHRLPSSADEEACSSSDVAGAGKKSKVCLVCGDKALGCNFNAVSCESCKAFFRRNAHKVIRGRCEGKCVVTVESRSFCKRCRLAKCVTVGMRKELILNDEQKKQRKQKIIVNKLRRSGHMSPQDTYAASAKDLLPLTPPSGDCAHRMGHPRLSGSITPNGTSLYNEDEIKSEYPPSDLTPRSEVSSPGSGRRSCTPGSTDSPGLFTPWSDSASQVEAAIGNLDLAEQVIIREVQTAVESTGFLAMSTSSLKMIPTTPEDFLNIAEKFVRRVIKMAKNIRFFTGLHRQDQISLLKSSVVDIMMLRSAVNYDPFTESWSLSTRDCISSGSHNSSGERLRAQELMSGSKETRAMFMTYAKFIKSLMSVIHGDLLALSLLIMMSLFSADRSPMAEHKRIQEIQERYGCILESYVYHRFNAEKTVFARMIMKLTDLRNLNEVHSNMLMSMKMQNIEPLLLEVFDIPCVDESSTASPDSSSGSSSAVRMSSSSSSSFSSKPSSLRHLPSSTSSVCCSGFAS